MTTINKPDFKKGDLLYNPLFSWEQAKEKGLVYEFIEWGKTHSDWISIFLRHTTTNKIGEYGYSLPRNFVRVSDVSSDIADVNVDNNNYIITLITDANYKKNKYAICDINDSPVWYGYFTDRDFVENQADAELKAALKAVWLAGKIKEQNNITNLELILLTDAEYLTYQDNERQKGYRLTESCNKHGITLTVKHIWSETNPADKYTRCAGYMSHKGYEKLENLIIKK